MNALKTTFFLSSLMALCMAGGFLLGGESGLIIGFAVALLSNFVAYFYSDKLVLMRYKAQPASPAEFPRLHAMVEELCARGNLPVPKLYVLPSDGPNAFATGRNPKHGAVAVTMGLLKLMNEEELKGVLAHELGHIKNRDVLLSTVAATLAGTLAFIAAMARWAMIFGGGRSSRDGENPLAALLGIILLPFAAVIIQLALSRTREYAADKTGAELAGNPYGLASALEKLDRTSKSFGQIPASPNSAHLFIVKPAVGGFLRGLFSTHPPMDKRIARLRGE